MKISVNLNGESLTVDAYKRYSCFKQPPKKRLALVCLKDKHILAGQLSKDIKLYPKLAAELGSFLLVLQAR